MEHTKANLSYFDIIRKIDKCIIIICPKPIKGRGCNIFIRQHKTHEFNKHQSIPYKNMEFSVVGLPEVVSSARPRAS